MKVYRIKLGDKYASLGRCGARTAMGHVFARKVDIKNHIRHHLFIYERDDYQILEYELDDSKARVLKMEDL